MNCYEFTAIDKMKLSFVMGGTAGFTGTQTNTSKRPTTRICLLCKTRNTSQDIPSPIPPRKYNQCTKAEFSALAIRKNATCFRFMTTKLAWNDDVSISQGGNKAYYLSFSAGRTQPYVYPALLKPWKDTDPYYDKALSYYNAQKQLPGYNRLQATMWLRNTLFPYETSDLALVFPNFEDGTVGTYNNGEITATLSVEFQ